MNLFRKSGQPGAESVILLYHRVANVKTDPHQLAVNTRNFYDQLKAMKKRLPAVSVTQIVEGIINKKPVRGFAVTFDDGYADNFYGALPILKKLGIPATIFVVVGKIDKNEPYFWDKETSASERGRPMSLAELKKIDSEPLVETGAHTMTHPHLGAVSELKQNAEIEGSKQSLEIIVGHKIAGLAYPFGASEKDFTDKTKQITKAAGFKYACINIRGKIDKDFSDLFGLPRVLVRDWQASEMMEEIKDVLPE